MSNKDYYVQWLKLKEQLKAAFAEDERIHDLAINYIGVKPQATAVEMVARVYSKYCELYNKLCECFDQMEQAQRRPYIKMMIDALTCRIIELKKMLEEIEVFEFTYPDNALQQMLITPQNVEVLCPFFYPFEIRQAEMQYIMDQILAGNRIGDPTPTPSELERKEEEIFAEKIRLKEEKDEEIKRKLALGFTIDDSEIEIVLSPKELETKRLQEEYNFHIYNIQRMERSRVVTREKIHKAFKDENLYLELAELKKPPVRIEMQNKAADLITFVLRIFMNLKRKHTREKKIKEKLGMVFSATPQLSAKVRLEQVKEDRRKFRRKYYEQWLEQTMKENAHVLQLRSGDIMDDITEEIRTWFKNWFNQVRVFDEFPFPEEGGSILIVRGDTFSIEEYLAWRITEEKRLKAEGENPKTKDQIKAEKKFAKEEKRRIAQEAKERERKRLIDYRKQRMNPDNDPGIYFQVGNCIEPLQKAWANYEGQWKYIDKPDASLDAIKGHIKALITETAYHDAHIQLRPIVDEAMKMELQLLRTSMKIDYANAMLDIPITKKRKKPKRQKPPKKEKVLPKIMFQTLADQGIVRKYPHVTLDDFWGDRNYAAADCRSVLWTPTFPPPCLGDAKELVRIRCLLTLGAQCQNLQRSQLFVGPRGCGKKTLIYAIATETNSLLIDLSPLYVYNKFMGPKNTKMMFSYINKISRLMQPTIILVDNAEKMFYKKVPKEEKNFNPTRFSKDFFREIIKPLGLNDKILILGTATEPWLAKTATMIKVFPSLIMIPRTDYGSISFILTKILMKYHGIDRDFNVHSLAQSLRGYDIGTIKQAVTEILKGKRLTELYYRPLQPMEILSAVLNIDTKVFTDNLDASMFNDWYILYSSWGKKYLEYMAIIDSQYQYKLKADKKNKF